MSRPKHASKLLTIATVAMHPDLDPLVNRERMKIVIEQTKRDHPDVRLIFFGETILGWFYKKGETQAYHESIAESIPGPSTDFVADLARAQDIYISFGLSEREGDKLYNAQVVISPEGEIVARHRKFWIRNKVFTPGDRKLTTVSIDGVNAAILICADARSLELVRNIRRNHVEIVLASLADYATSTRMNQLIGSLFDAWVVIANRVGEESSRMWHGLITVTDPWARLCTSGMGREQVLVHHVEISDPRAVARFLRRVCVGCKFVGMTTVLIIQMVWQAITKKRK
jgi:formamidase